MIAELGTARPAGQKTRMHGPPMPDGSSNGRHNGQGGIFPHEIDLPYPAIEELPSFVRRIESRDFQPGVRHYNGSIARHSGRIFMAYRVESYRAVSSVGVCELNEEFSVIRGELLSPELSNPETQIEDPHLASVRGRLICIVSNVVRGAVSTCQQRILIIDPDTLGICGELAHALGNVNGIEKNWTPFELPDGSLGVVYKQRPRTIARVNDREGWTWEGPDMRQKGDGSTVSGRTGPLRLPDGNYLEFVGGHVKLPPTARRGTRYWFGALVFEGKAPFRVLAHTAEPLAWASEASPTIFNPLPGGGHPVCIMPAGALVTGSDVFVSCGVNDSYNVILRFDMGKIMSDMTAA